MFIPFYRFITPLALVVVFCKITVHAQDLIVSQSLTGNSRTDLRGQAFIPAEIGDGVGSTFSLDTLYLSEFNVYYASGTEADKLYIFENLPASTSELDAGTGGTLIGESFNKELLGSKVSYKFGNLALKTNTTYFAVFLQDVELWYGETAEVVGPYAGGKMLHNNGINVVENDYTALQFSAYFYHTESVNQNDLNALIALYNATDGANWTNRWDLNSDPSEWYGTYWDNNNKRLTSIELGSNNLVGSIPDNIGTLSNLETLKLDNNQMEGIIPTSIGGMNNLKELNLSHNNIYGKIPGSINNLIHLEQIDVSFNKLTFLPGLSLPALRYMRVGQNYFQFDSFESNVAWINDPTNNHDFWGDQRFIPHDNQFFELGQTVTLTVNVKGENNLYQWYKYYSSVSEMSSNPELTIEGFDEDDIAEYYCQIQSSIVPYVDLRTESFYVVSPIEFKNNDPDITQIQATSISFSSTINKNGNIFYLALPSGSMVPSLEQILVGRDFYNDSVNNSSNTWVRKGVLKNLKINNLEFNTAYDFYFVVQDEYKITTDNVTVTATTIEPIYFVDDYLEVDYVGTNRVIFKTIVNRSCILQYAFYPGGTILLSDSSIHSGDSYWSASFDIDQVGEIVEFEITNGINPSKKYDIYMIATDNEGFKTDIKKFEITTIAGGFSDGYPEKSYLGAENVKFNVKVNRDGMLYYVAIPENEFFYPNINQIKNGLNGNNQQMSIYDSLELTADVITEIEVTGLESESDYVIIFGVEDIDEWYEISKVYLSTITGLIENSFSSKELSIYPNPTSDRLYVDFRQNEKYRLTITNLNGQEIYHKKDAKYKELVDVKSFKQGVYLINIKTKDKSGWIRVVKE